MPPSAEEVACQPTPIDPRKCNSGAQLPYGLQVGHVRNALEEFVRFLGFLNGQLRAQGLRRMETMMEPASFSTFVGEFAISALPKSCRSLARNNYHNGHPDLVPAGQYPDNAAQHGADGVEVKASRYKSGWQGHNAEDCWLMVFVYEGNRPGDQRDGVPSSPFRFTYVALGRLAKSDWSESGRKEGSRRTPTAAVTVAGSRKVLANWIYQDAPPAAAGKRKR